MDVHLSASTLEMLARYEAARNRFLNEGGSYHDWQVEAMAVASLLLITVRRTREDMAADAGE